MILLFTLFIGLFHQAASAADITVVDVRRNITLAEDDPVYKDFYINAGPGSGLKKNLVVTAVRKINIRDASGASAVGEILVPVGQLKIIAVYDRVAVAREFTLLSRDELPMLEQTGIMSGDRIDLQGAFIDTSKPKYKKKVAEVEIGTLTTTVAMVTRPVSDSVSDAAFLTAPMVASGSTATTTATASTNSTVTNPQATAPTSSAAAPATAAPLPTPTAVAPTEIPVTVANPVESANSHATEALKPTPVASADAKTMESLEKTAVSSNNTQHE
ncbi:hypothetical protein [Bdellovibrio reynosensis]|uniref:Uncharacterized protein n=1 Tax=Bdellovibrio reynosensis TaxID=2835041 RepID=A0ABY4C7U9_9BACT|nr:hypothetical protein [Bdellovibrio reynosensis]UOF00990.1 hypothetical protein MNR06_14910 [Bdellovibrio reynosensis]